MMSRIAIATSAQGPAHMARRLLVTFVISCALILGLVHGALEIDCVFADAAHSTVVSVDADVADSSHKPTQHSTASHCDHCLSHVTSQPFAAAVTSPVEFASASLTLASDVAPPSLAGLSPFEPPRI